MRKFDENLAAGAALPRNVQFPDISDEQIGFLDELGPPCCWSRDSENNPATLPVARSREIKDNPRQNEEIR